MTGIVAAGDLEPMPMDTATGRFLVAWHPPGEVPAGRMHGAAGVCVEGARLVLIGPDGVHWGFPAGRPEGDETMRQTLDRELREEACVEVRRARLLGYSRGECVDGAEAGLVLVRSYWRAEVAIGPWQPRFEIRHRRVVAAGEATRYVRDPDPVATRISFRALVEAGLA